MKYKELGRTGEKIPEIGMGSWQLGHGEGQVEALRAGLDAGCRFIDTAEIYQTEDVVGRAIKGKKDVFVATKVWPSNLHYDDVIRACDASLKRLGLKQVDLYQIHWPNKTIPIEETMAAMEKLVDDGKIRYIGLSNFSAKEMQEAQDTLKRNTVVSNQVEYSVLVRDVEKELLAACKKEHVTLIAYSPFGNGAFFEPRFAPFVEALTRIGAAHGKSASQVAIAWLLEKDPVVTIPKASSKEHVLENIEASGFKLTREELAAIDELCKKYKKSPLVPLHLGSLLKHTTFWHGSIAKRWMEGRGKKP